MAMTEWQDVGMSGAEKEQLQAIYDAVIEGQVVFNMEGLDTLNPVATGNHTTGSQSTTWEADKDYPYLIVLYTEHSASTHAITWTLQEGENFGTYTMSVGNNGTFAHTTISFVSNVKAGDSVVISKTASGSQGVYAILRNRTT